MKISSQTTYTLEASKGEFHLIFLSLSMADKTSLIREHTYHEDIMSKEEALKAAELNFDLFSQIKKFLKQ